MLMGVTNINLKENHNNAIGYTIYVNDVTNINLKENHNKLETLFCSVYSVTNIIPYWNLKPPRIFLAVFL